jgi:hypothetical protein
VPVGVHDGAINIIVIMEVPVISWKNPGEVCKGVAVRIIIATYNNIDRNCTIYDREPQEKLVGRGWTWLEGNEKTIINPKEKRDTCMNTYLVGI